MTDFTAEEKASARSVVLSGRLSVRGNSDFRQLRDLCWQLERLDISQADCEAIPANAFHSRHRLREVILPRNLGVLGARAFFACDSLLEVSLPSSVTSVGTEAFSGCKSLRQLVVEGCPEIGDFAFAHCSALRSIVLTSEEPPVLAESAFEGIDFSRCRLTVPAGTEARYRSTAGWSRFYGVAAPSPFRLCRPTQCLVPVPAELHTDYAAMPLPVKRSWQVVADERTLDNEQRHALRILSERTGMKASLHKGENRLHLRLAPEGFTNEEAYRLRVDSCGVEIVGSTPAGVFYGLMTLEQLLVGDGGKRCCDALPYTVISDAPRCRMRELMVDPARIFIPFEDLKSFVPEMARYKLNALHLHLVDDQAWRIEIKSYPRLTELSSSRTGMDDMQLPVSGFYTQDQMRELVDYARKYHVEIIPEIEMPGHEVAAIHAYPQLTCGGREVPLRTTCGVSNELLCPGEEFVYEFLGNVLGELAAIFPSPYVHLGGDEAGTPPLDCWTSCEKCNRLKQQLGITTTDRSENWRLQKYLFDRITDTLRTRYGKTPMFWYETDFKEIQPGCITFAWRHGLTAAAIDAAMKNGAKIMLCPGEHCYLDYPMAAGDMPEVNWGMPVTSLRRTYELDPSWGRGADFEQNHLFGVAGTLWSECINSPERIFYQAYPRALALSEAGWSLPQHRSWDGFMTRLRPLLRDMQRRGVPFALP